MTFLTGALGKLALQDPRTTYVSSCHSLASPSPRLVMKEARLIPRYCLPHSWGMHCIESRHPFHEFLWYLRCKKQGWREELSRPEGSGEIQSIAASERLSPEFVDLFLCSSSGMGGGDGERDPALKRRKGRKGIKATQLSAAWIILSSPPPRSPRMKENNSRPQINRGGREGSRSEEASRGEACALGARLCRGRGRTADLYFHRPCPPPSPESKPADSTLPPPVFFLAPERIIGEEELEGEEVLFDFTIYFRSFLALCTRRRNARIDSLP